MRRYGVAAFACALTATGTMAEEACRFVTTSTATVRSLADTDVVLDDGRTVRLAGLNDVSETEVRSALKPGTTIVLKRLATVSGTDRYGRVAAHVFISDGSAERWLQAELVARGNARVSSRVGDVACARELLVREQLARAGKLGLWAEPYYVIGKAEVPAEVLERRGRFALVEGKVISVRESGGTIYVNFGRRWSEDFTVTIAKRSERAFSAAGLEPNKLAGRQVRIRGWIEERGGPWVEVSRPEQIEVLTSN